MSEERAASLHLAVPAPGNNLVKKRVLNIDKMLIIKPVTILSKLCENQSRPV